jgi:hypothetical protein
MMQWEAFTQDVIRIQDQLWIMFPSVRRHGPSARLLRAAKMWAEELISVFEKKWKLSTVPLHVQGMGEQMGCCVYCKVAKHRFQDLKGKQVSFSCR